MIKDIITKYQISEYITLKVIKTKFLGITIKSTVYIVDIKNDILKLI